MAFDDYSDEQLIAMLREAAKSRLNRYRRFVYRVLFPCKSELDATDTAVVDKIAAILLTIDLGDRVLDRKQLVLDIASLRQLQ